MARFFVIVLVLITGQSISAQNAVALEVAPAIGDLLELFQTENEEMDKIPGWRVQVLATTDRNRLETVERQFKVNYPSIAVDWVHTKPYYKLRAGAFETKQEAERLKFTLGEQFEGVYLVKDDISEAELLKMY